jgi:hypothetical protein
MHSVTWLSHRKSRTSPNSIPKPLYLFCTSYSLNTTYFRSFVSSLAWFYFKIKIVFMQEIEESRALKRKIKMSREGKVKRKICVWENEREWLKKKKKKKKWRKMARKTWEGWIKWNKKKVRGRMSRCWETELLVFFQPCAIRQWGRHQCLVVIFSFAHAQVHHSISSHPWYPHIWFILMIIGFER